MKRAGNFSGLATPKPPPEMLQYLQLTRIRQVPIDSCSPKYHTARVDRSDPVLTVVGKMRESYAGAVLVTDGAGGACFRVFFGKTR